VEEIAEIYIQGDKKKLKSHKCPVLGGRAASYTNSKVVDRLQHEEVKLPFLV
jgi:predicted Rossmann fold nucleotide-binding protein DprA/Smf involved in DNA uptake